MTARHPRIKMSPDPNLDRAIARGRALLGRNFLLAVADREAGLNYDSLRTVRDRAWSAGR